MFNTAQHCHVESDVLNELRSYSSLPWARFTEEELTSSLLKYSNISTPGSDKLSWKRLKIILKNKICLRNVIIITNTCIKLGHWPSHFKISLTIVISKPNKASYNLPKIFRLIILLNILGKLIKKVISDRIQFHVVANNFIHHSQLSSLKFKSMTDAGITLTHFICMGWVKNILTNILAFNISQFFPFLNYHLLSLILKKAGLDSLVIQFFSSYLINRSMQYVCNNFSSHFVDINVRVDQDSALSPILLALYLASFLHILEKCLKNLNL